MVNASLVFCIEFVHSLSSKRR